MKKWSYAAAAVLVVVVLWMTRYDPIEGTTLVLDRWSGSVIDVNLNVRTYLGNARDRQ